MKIIALVLWPLAAAVSVSASAAAGAFPERPLRIVVPFAPGGGSDFVVRVLATRLPEVLGQNAVVDNRPGGASLLATQLVANAPNDGYTLILQDLIPFVVNHTIYKNAGYDPVRSFSPVARIATTPMLFVVNPAVPARSVQEFVALAKSQPGNFTMGNGGTGGATHLAAVLFAQTARIDMTMVPYKGGTGPALTDVIGGHVHAIIATGPAVMPHVKSGRLRVLAVASDKRLTLVPEAPTVLEAGLQGYVVANTYVMVTAARTPAPILAKLHDAFVRILQLPDIASRMAAAIIEPAPSASPEELRTILAAEVVRWGRVVKAADIRLD